MDILYGKYKNTPTLIDQFCIFGYDPTNKELISKAVDGYRNDIGDEKKNDLMPIVINAIGTLRNKEMLKADEVLQYLFPYNPSIYKNVLSEQIPSYDLTFSCLDEGKLTVDIDKTFGYAFVFYEKFDSLWIPKIFCITSQYPFFSLFRQIANKIYAEFEKDTISIPIEIQIFNIINCLPPPVANPMLLDLSPGIILSKSRIPQNMHRKEKRNFQQFSQQRSNNKLIEYKLKIHEIEKSNHIDFNCAYFLQMINPDILAKLIILSFFETYIIIFSKDLTFLDNLLQFLTLLYSPFIEIQYYRNSYSLSRKHITSVEEEEKYEKEEEQGIQNKDRFYSPIVGNPIPAILGINFEYSTSFQNFGAPSIVINLDKKQELYKSRLDNQIMNILQLVENSIRQYDELKPNKVYEPKSKLESIIINIYSKIKALSAVIRGNATRVNKDVFCDNSFQEESNYSLQNIAYEYIVEMFNYFQYSNKSFKSNYVNDLVSNEKLNITQIKFEIINNPQIEDKWFSDIRGLSGFKFDQYNKYFSNELKENFMIDMAILDCFMHYKINTPNEKEDIKYMEIMKEIYDKIKKDKNILYQHNMTFNEFNAYYYNNLEKFFKQEMAKSPSIFEPIEYENNDGDEKYVEYAYINKELDPQLIMKYYRHLKSLSMNDLTKMFPSFNSSQKQKRSVNHKIIPVLMQDILFNYIKKSMFEEILSLLLNISLLTINELCDKSPFFYLIYNNTQIPRFFYYYYLMDMITMIYINVKLKINNKSTDIKKEMDTLYLTLEFMEQKQIIPNRLIMEKLNELFTIESNFGNIIRQKKDVGIKEQYESIFNKKVKVTIKGKKPKEVKEIINGFKFDSSNSTISLLRNDNSVIGEVKVDNVKNLNKNTREIINDCILSERTITMEEKTKLRSIVINVIAFIYANETIKVDLTSLLDYLG